MMIGDCDDMKGRLLSVLPARWFGLTGVVAGSGNLAAATPVLNGLLSGIAAGLSIMFDLFTTVRRQTRLATASDEFLEMIAVDYFGTMISRRANESDDAFRDRIGMALFLPRGTRNDLAQALLILTGRMPAIFEPARVADTGAYGHLGEQAFGLAYGIAGGWGSLEMPFEMFVRALRPVGEGIAMLGGYSTGGSHVYGNLSMVASTVSDREIYAEIARTIPAATRAWVRIDG